MFVVIVQCVVCMCCQYDVSAAVSGDKVTEFSDKLMEGYANFTRI